MTKKIFVLIISLVIIALMSFSAYAGNNNVYLYQVGNMTIFFEQDTPFDEAQREEFVQLLSGNSNATEPCGLACLFGHNYEIAVVRTVTHNANTFQPKCFEETFELSECTRCGKQVVERIGYRYIVCCE